MKRAAFIVLVGVFLTGAASAQYKYIGPNGEVTYSDAPPPAGARDVQVKSLATTDSGPSLPYDVRQAASRFPVTLFTGDGCPGCDQGRAYLKARGIPYNEKLVATSADLEVLKSYSKDGNIPLLVVGSQKLSGYSESAWGSVLDDAGYPASSHLPPGYQNPAPQAAAKPDGGAPPPVADSGSAPQGAAPAAPAAPAPPPPAPTGNAPPGFRF